MWRCVLFGTFNRNALLQLNYEYILAALALNYLVVVIYNCITYFFNQMQLRIYLFHGSLTTIREWYLGSLSTDINELASVPVCGSV